jgi:non-ribosomal peptide synthetase component F
MPKGVSISMLSLSNYLMWAKTEYCSDMKPIMPFFTSISVDLSITSYLLPLVAGGEIIIYNDKNSLVRIQKMLKDDKVNMVKMTPSHLKVINSTKLNCSSIRRMILGGEALNRATVDKVRMKFKNQILIYNEYGPTEATVGCMIYLCKQKEERFNIPIGTGINNCKIYVLDKDNNHVPKYGIGELYIGGTCLSKGYVNQDELTEGVFLNNILGQGERLYETGDIVKVLHDNNIEYLGRKDEQIKVRGNRVEIAEIESAVYSHPDIEDVYIGVDQSTDSLILIVVSNANIDVKKLSHTLELKLPPYMLPSDIVVTESLSIGKNEKRSITEMYKMLKKRPVEKEKVMPENAVQKSLWDIWVKVLNREDFGIDDDFFVFGGHSLNVASLAGNIYSSFSVLVELGELFEKKTIREQADLIEEMVATEIYTIEKCPKKEFYKASFAQTRMYMFNELYKDSTLYNTPLAFVIEGKIDKSHLEAIINEIIRRQEGLRTSFIYENGQILQRVLDSVSINIEYGDIEEGRELEFFNKFIRPFDLSTVPILRIGLLKYKNSSSRYLFVLDMHHIVTDGYSMLIFVKEFSKLYRGESLPELELQYTDFSEWQNRIVEEGKLARELDYWKHVYESPLEEYSIPISKKNNTDSLEGSIFEFTFNENTSEKVEAFCKSNEVTEHMFFISVFSILMQKWCSTNDIVIGTATAGRFQKELQSIIGVFINMIPVRFKRDGNMTWLEYLKKVKRDTIDAYNNSELPVDMIRHLIPNAESHYLMDITFTTQNFNNTEIKDFNIEGIEFKAFNIKTHQSHTKLNFVVRKTRPNIIIDVEYLVGFFSEYTIEYLADEYKRILSLVLEDIDILVNDL